MKLTSICLTTSLLLTTCYAEHGLITCEKHNDCGKDQSCYFSYDDDHVRSGICFALDSSSSKDVQDTQDLVRILQ